MKVVLYIAASLDGFIADRDGGVDWLERFTDPADGDYGYADFYDGIAAVAMGRTTYDQVRGFGDWPYPGKPTVVFTHDPPDPDLPDVSFTADDPAEVVASLREQTEGDPGSSPRQAIWLVGGGGLVASFRERGLIDEVILTVIPVLLGEGVPLFPGTQPEASLRLRDVQRFESGIVQLHYEVG
jgi:dihydrofolate reductase